MTEAKSEYPRGQISADDEGATTLATALDPTTNTLIMRFPTPTLWIGLGEEELESLMFVLARNLARMKRVPVSIVIGDPQENDSQEDDRS